MSEFRPHAEDHARQVNVAGDVHGPIDNSTWLQALPPRGPMIDTLRRDVDTFIGRDGEIDQILQAAGGGRVVSVDGMPGVGKTATVTRVAHRLADRFPDGRYFVDLHAHTPGHTPADPIEVLGGLLTARGVDPRHIPDTFVGRRDLWLDQLARRRVLLVLDDARDAAQVEPLLPAGAGCLTLITSRRRLIALPGAVPVSLQTLDPDTAARLFTTLARRRADADIDRTAVASIVELCGWLPLAIGLLAGRCAHHPTWTIPMLAANLPATGDRLGQLGTGHDAVEVAFTLSYQNLPAEQQHLFRRLGLHPGPDIEPAATAALADITPTQAARQLDALYTDHLLDETGPGRYRLHDLLREYARTLTDTVPLPDRTNAVDQLLDHYHSAGSAGGEAALAWMRGERDNLLACLEYAAWNNQPARLVQFTAMLMRLLYRDGPWTLAIELHHRAATAAAELGDRLGEATALNNVGNVHLALDEYSAAAELSGQALDIYRDIGDRLGEADALNNLGNVRLALDEYSAAAELCGQALDIYRDIGNRFGEATTLNNLGNVRRTLGGYSAAAELYRQALDIHHDIGNRLGEATTLNNLGNVRLALEQHSAAAKLYEQALDIHYDIGNRLGEANALNNLGNVRRTLGEYSAAAELYGQALGIYRDIGDRLGEANALNNLGEVRSALDEYSAAADLYEQALDIHHDIGNRLGEADALNNLGNVRSALDEYSAAADLYEQALDIYRDIGNRLGEANALRALGQIPTPDREGPAVG